jgi:soluble P-type ATPase
LTAGGNRVDCPLFLFPKCQFFFKRLFNVQLDIVVAPGKRSNKVDNKRDIMAEQMVSAEKQTESAEKQTESVVVEQLV